jgi:site-specific DNA recombinase
MKRAALYARVSDELSAKEGTIESQVLALKKQIAVANHTLVKEYIDNGFSGPRFDRPALDRMRRDLKTDAFDVIYFFSPDRIAREVVIQTIIIEEILKHRKQLVINGKDYEKNPENHFSLTVLGAVAELERAKIIERTTRGRALRLSQGQLMGSGVHTFGYDYIRKSPGNPPQMVINEQEAAIVRRVFEMYADTREPTATDGGRKAKPRGRSVSSTAMHTSATGRGAALCIPSLRISNAATIPRSRGRFLRSVSLLRSSG